MKNRPSFFPAFFFFFVLMIFALPAAHAVDCWLSVSGTGLKNGTDALNAYSASLGRQDHYAQTCWNQTSAEGTMHVLEGNYTMGNKAFWKLTITSANDGAKSQETFKKLVGEGPVVMEGEGGIWITLGRGASRLWIQNFHVARVSGGIVAEEGGNQHLQLRDLSFEDTRQNIVIFGHPDCESRASCPSINKEGIMSQDILIENTSGRRYSKRHVRLGKGVFGVRVVNSHADAEFLDGDFAVGFDVENPSHDIEFSHSTSRGNLYTLSSYWNGDGFKAEDETYNIRWSHCAAFDNGDAGFDIKTDSAVLENIIALRNNRNIRTWSMRTAVITNANASYSKHRGGEGPASGLWTQGRVDCHFCTLHNNAIQAHAENNHRKRPQIHLYDSILSTTAAIHGEMIRQEKGTSVELTRSVVWVEGVTGKDPKFGKGADENWEGGNSEFDSRRYGKKKGYSHDDKS